MSEKKKSNITRDQAVSRLWAEGELSWTLTDVQKEIKADIENDTSRTNVVVCGRRTGKTWLLVTLALETCLKKENAIVKFLLPKQKDAKTIIKPLMREILESCPLELRPKYNSQDKIYYFEHNGSEIHLGGSDLSAESLRGTKAHLVLIDEGGFVNDLLYCIRSILSPTIRTTRGRMIIASTPSRDPQHEFVQHFMLPYKASGRLKIYNIYQNPNFNEDIINEIISEYPLGVEDPDFKREYLCEVIVDEETTVCPEFSRNKRNIIIKDYELPEFCDFYVGADVGYRDLTVMLFGYYDFSKATLYILDELVMNGPEMTTDKLALEINQKERINFFHDGGIKVPHLRVMDNDLKLINDLQQLHKINFLATRKDNRDGAINEMRMWINNSRVKVHERCKHLSYHLEFGQWNSSRSDFKRLPDTPDKSVRGGHVDAIPALYYLIRNININKNPYPFGFGLDMNESTHMSAKYKKRQESKGRSIMNKLFRKKQ